LIKLLRIDDRLLHGQVAFLWKEYLKLDTILICNDDAADDSFTKQILKFAKPKEVQLIIVSLGDAAEKISSLALEPGISIIIVGSLFDAEKIIDMATLTCPVNIGGLRERPNSISLCEYVAVTNEDIQIIKNLLKHKCKISIRRAPKDNEIQINDNMPLLS